MAQDNPSANQIEMYPLILTTYLVLRHKFRFKRNIERLYIGQQLSAREIAIKLGCSHNAVNKSLRHLKIDKSLKIRRPKYGRPSPSKSEKQLIQEKQIISIIFNFYNKGVSYRSICKFLNYKKVPSPSGHGSWVQSTIKRIIQGSTM